MTILAVAVAAVVSVSLAKGPFNIWTFMLGTVLLFVLLTYEITPSLRRCDKRALSVTWGFSAIIALGLFFQVLYDTVSPLWPSIFPLRCKDQEAPGLYYFFWWI